MELIKVYTETISLTDFFTSYQINGSYLEPMNCNGLQIYAQGAWNGLQVNAGRFASGGQECNGLIFNITPRQGLWLSDDLLITWQGKGPFNSLVITKTIYDTDQKLADKESRDIAAALLS